MPCNEMAALFLLLCSFLADPKLGKVTNKVGGAGEGLCPGTHVFWLPPQEPGLHPGICSFPFPCLLFMESFSHQVPL